MQAIQTRFIGATNTKGSRVKAFTEGFPRGITVGYEYAASVEGAHDAAFLAFVRARGWFGLWARGASADKRGNTYVCISTAYSPVGVKFCKRFQRSALLCGLSHETLLVLE